MADFDLFNGDADGLCALHQLRLADPREAELVTGVKRDIALLTRVSSRVRAGDRLTVLDVSVEPNAAALNTVLNAGASVDWFDHHNPGLSVPEHPAFTPRIDTASDVCTSALVDRHLQGRYRMWAIAAAYGDGLPRVATALAYSLRIPERILESLAQLGEALNYNAYGESPEDLHIHPADLYRRMSAYENPLDFVRGDSAVGELAAALLSDMAKARGVAPSVECSGQRAYVLPDAAWARRVSGPFANHVASGHPDDAVAILTPTRSSNYLVSVRAPRRSPVGADKLCRQFSTGGGRQAAAGINALPPEQVPQFLRAFQGHFQVA